MPQRPVAPGPGRDDDPGRVEEDWLAWCEAVEEQLGPDEEEPEDAAPWDVDIDTLIADCRQVTAEEAALAMRAARRGLPGGTPVADGRRGPEQPGSAARRPGEFVSRAAGFGAGMALDVMPGCGALAGFAAEAAGADDRYAGACDDEVAGAIAAWDRVEAYAAARKHAAAAEFIRRRPEPGCAVQGTARMPEVWDESAAAEVAGVLAESRSAADAVLGLAYDLEVKLPGTRAAFYDGVLRQSKVVIIARATAVLDPAEARAAERLVLDRAGRLTPGALRAAIARAVMEVAPEKAKKRREVAAKFARVERWAEDSGNAAVAGRELPPDEVFAVEQRIAWWAGELKKAGLEGGTDEIRARAPAGPAARRGLQARPFRRSRAGRVRRAGDADRAADDGRRAGRPARRDPRDRAHRPLAGPRPGRRGRPQPRDDVVRDGDRRAGTRHRPRLRPARTQAAPETRRTRHPGRARVRVRSHRRTRDLAAARPRGRAGPAGQLRSGHHAGLRSQVPGPGS